MARRPPKPLPPYDQVKDLQVFKPEEAAVFIRASSVKAMRRKPIRKAREGHRTVRYLRKDLLAYLEGHAA